MWDKVKNTRKYFYVSNPAHGGGLYNYGLAVDITLCTVHGDSIPMGTKVDYMEQLHTSIMRRSWWQSIASVAMFCTTANCCAR